MDEFAREPTQEERDLLDFMIEANREDASIPPSIHGYPVATNSKQP